MKYIIISTIVIVSSVLGYLGYQRLNNASSKVKTDPSFYEIKGKVIEGFPTDFPVYPGAKLEGSSNVNPKDVPDEGYRVKWKVETSNATVPQIMEWYAQEIPKYGWEFTPPDDYESTVEQVGYIKGSEMTGYLAAEVEEGEIEIVIDVRKD